MEEFEEKMRAPSAVRGSAPAAARHPAAAPLGAKMSEVVTWLATLEKHHRKGAALVDEAATTLFVGIKKSSRVPFGLDKRVFALKMRMHLRRAAAAEWMAAQAYKAAGVEIRRQLGQTEGHAKIRKEGIDLRG